MSKNLKTGDLVLCKVGSFPPWPAVVFPQRFLRNDVYRKRKANSVAVCFFNDPTYYWEQPGKLLPLDTEVLEQFLRHGYKTTSQSDLIDAYKEARDFTDLHTFIVDRFTEEDRLDDLKDEEDEKIEQGEDPFMKKPDKPKKKLAISSVKNSNGKRKMVSEPEEGPDIVDEEEYGSTPTKATKKRSKLDITKNVEISLLFRRRIQKSLIQRDTTPSKEELVEAHKLLQKIDDNLDNEPPFFDIDALRQSKLPKLLKVIVNNPTLKEFHPICKKILIHWTDIIAQLKSEKVKKEEETQQLKQKIES